MLKLFSAPITNERGPRFMERVFAAVHQSLTQTSVLILHVATVNGRIALVVECDEADEQCIVTPMNAHFPQATLKTIAAVDTAPPHWKTWSHYVTLTPEIFPILRHAQFEDTLSRGFADPITGILRAVAPTEFVLAQASIAVRPATHRRCRRAEKAVRTLDREFFHHHEWWAEFYALHVYRGVRRLPAAVVGWFARRTALPSRSTLDISTGRQHDREGDLQSAAAKVGGHLFEAKIRLQVQAPVTHAREAQERLRQIAAALGAFTEPRLASFHSTKVRRRLLPLLRGPRFLFSHDELATLFHAPLANGVPAGMQSSEFHELEPPARFHDAAIPGTLTLGRIRYRDDQRLFSLDAEALRRHIYCVGATGTGKSTLLLNLIQQTMQAGRGLTLIDVHGDLADAALALVPPARTNDVILFEATGPSVVPFNPLSCSDPVRIDHVTSGVVSAFKKLFDSWGPRLESLLRFSVHVAVEQHGTLLDVLRLLTDKSYRDVAVGKIEDEVVRAFWQNEFPSWAGQYRTEAVSSVTNKLAPTLASRRLRAILAAPGRDSLNLREVLDEGKILIINVSRGLLGQDHATLLGSLLLTSIEQAALSRANLPAEARRDHLLFLDEFQSLLTPSTAIMLSEARKYALSLVLSHQLTHQLDPDTYHSVIGNCGTLIALRVGVEDADKLAPAFSKFDGQVAVADLCNLPNHTAYVRALIDGHPSRPFSLSTLPPPVGDAMRAEIVRRTSARQHGVTMAAGIQTSGAPVSVVHA